MEQNLWRHYTFNQLSLSTQQDVYSPGCVNLPVSKCFVPAAQPEFCHQNPTVTFRTKVCNTLAVLCSCPAFITVVIQANASWLGGCQRKTKLYKNLTCVPRAAHGYHVKLQHHEYTERRMPDKIPIRLTSVGLAHARPNYITVAINSTIIYT